MKIPGHTQRTKIERRRDSKPDATEASRAEGGTGPAAQVQMSDAARALERAHAPEAPDMAKVARLRDAIANGQLKIDPERIASRMIQEEL